MALAAIQVVMFGYLVKSIIEICNQWFDPDDY